MINVKLVLCDYMCSVVYVIINVYGFWGYIVIIYFY